MKNCKEMEQDVFIVLNDFNTATEDIRVLELGVKKPSSLKYEVSEAYGQEGYTKVSEDAYRGFERTSRLLISSKESHTRFMDKFYIGKDVKVYYSDDDYKFRYGTISEMEDDVLIGDNREIEITIDLQPFKYADELTIDITEETTITNTGNIYTTPIIKVYGDGIGNVYIGNQRMELDVNEHITVNNKDGQQDVFNKDGLRANSKRLEGNFMRINTGSNTITFDGAITKLEIAVSWRWR